MPDDDLMTVLKVLETATEHARKGRVLGAVVELDDALGYVEHYRAGRLSPEEFAELKLCVAIIRRKGFK